MATSPVRRTATRRDRVTPEVAEAVFEADAQAIWYWAEERIHRHVTREDYWRGRILCIAPAVDEQSGPCSGRTTLDHVHEEHGVGKRRAASDLEHLVSVCEAHMEAGAMAGHVWNLSHREEERWWLAKFRKG